MADERNLDEQLAAFTDALLAGKDPVSPVDLEAETRVIRLLQRAIAADEDLPAQKKITERVTTEYLRHMNTAVSPRRPMRSLRPRQVWQMAAAAALVLLSAALALSLLDGTNNATPTATAAGGEGWVLILGVVMLGLGGLWLYRWRGRR